MTDPHIEGTSLPTPMAATDPEVPGQAGPALPNSTEDLFTLLYQELHTLARRHLNRQAAGYTLGTSSLLHEAYLNLSSRSQVHFPDRARFLGYASRAMRGLIIDYLRRRAASKRGGEFHLMSLTDQDAPDPGGDLEGMIELSDGLDRLAGVDPSLVELVDLHFFCGLSFGEIAGLRGVSERTIERQWRKARLILHQTLHPTPPEEGAEG